MSRLIDADALIEFCAERWIPLNIDAVNMQPTIQPEKAQLSPQGTTSDMISKTETVEHLRRVLEATVPITDYDEGYVDGVEVGISTVSTMPTVQPQSTVGQLNDGVQSTNLIDRQAAIRWVKTECNPYGKPTLDFESGKKVIEHLEQMPPAQPEPTDINAKEAVYNLAEKIGIHQLFALTVELRGEPIQTEPAIPLSWTDKYIEWLKSLDNEFANLAAAHISVMVKKWRDEQNERPN